jgi:hypothetical protein
VTKPDAPTHLETYLRARAAELADQLEEIDSKMTALEENRSPIRAAHTEIIAALGQAQMPQDPMPTRAMRRKRRSKAQIAVDNEAARTKTVQAAGLLGTPRGDTVTGPQDIPEFLKRKTTEATTEVEE